MTTAAIRVVLADDHTLLRKGIRALLEKIQGVQVVAEATDGREALKLIEAKRPDVALMDISMPGLDGIATTTDIRSAHHSRKISFKYLANLKRTEGSISR